jgi:hypothetical protein
MLKNIIYYLNKLKKYIKSRTEKYNFFEWEVFSWTATETK